MHISLGLTHTHTRTHTAGKALLNNHISRFTTRCPSLHTLTHCTLTHRLSISLCIATTACFVACGVLKCVAPSNTHTHHAPTQLQPLPSLSPCSLVCLSLIVCLPCHGCPAKACGPCGSTVVPETDQDPPEDPAASHSSR